METVLFEKDTKRQSVLHLRHCPRPRPLPRSPGTTTVVHRTTHTEAWEYKGLRDLKFSHENREESGCIIVMLLPKSNEKSEGSSSLVAWWCDAAGCGRGGRGGFGAKTTELALPYSNENEM